MRIDKYNIFWHICELNNWQNVVNDQWLTILESGLINDIDNIFISFIGKNSTNIQFLLDQHSKIKLATYSSKYNEYERQCLHYLLEWSKEYTSNVLYIHAKGVSRPLNFRVWQWRKMLDYIFITNYKKCISKIDSYDIVSVNLCDEGNDDYILNEQHKKHFSGNFWWSKTTHIKNLPIIRPDYDDLSIDHRFWLCERWIMCNYPNNTYYEIYRSPKMKYYNSSPPEHKEIIINE